MTDNHKGNKLNNILVVMKNGGVVDIGISAMKDIVNKQKLKEMLETNRLKHFCT